MCLNGTTLGSVKMQSVKLPQVIEFKYMGTTLHSDGDMSTEINKRTQYGMEQRLEYVRLLIYICDTEYHHMLKDRLTR